MKLTWTRSAPKAPGYYWFLPSRYRSKWDNGRLSDQEPPTVIYRNNDGTHYHYKFTGEVDL